MSTDRDYLAAGLALGGLSETELTEAQALADSDADFRGEVASYADTMSLAAESDAPIEVSAETRAAILGIPSTYAQENSVHVVDHPASQAQATPTAADSVAPVSLAEHRESRARSRAGRRRSWLPYTAVAAALIVVAGFGVTIWQQTQEQNRLEEDLASTQQQLDESTRLMEADDLHTRTEDMPGGGTVTVLSSESEQLIRFSPRDVGQVPAGKSMQMWVIGIDGPESVGLVTDQPVTIAGHEFATGSVFGITLEPEGGSEQPTTDPVVAINL